MKSIVRFLVDYLVLPKNTSEFEDQYLRRMNKVATAFFVAHVPFLTILALLNDTGPFVAALLSLATLVGPLLAIRSFESRRAISTVMGITAMFMGGLLVHFGQGPVQIEMHFYFFVLLALLAVFANPMVIVAAAVTAAVHHAALWFFLPASVFNYDAPFWVVGVHAAFVVLESVAACFIARSFFDNVIGLEKKVAQRTSELASRNDDMQLLLDSVKQGFFTLAENGIVSEERSGAVERLLGSIEGAITFEELVRRHDPKAADWIELGLDDVFAGILPEEVTIAQLPSRIKVGSRTMSIEYSPVFGDQGLNTLAVVVSDVSADVERELLETENREMLAMIDRIATDRNGLFEFFTEAESLVESLRNRSESDLSTIKRQVHTLKGNSAIFGLQRVAMACHEIEDHIAENEEIPDSPKWTALFGSWASTRGNLKRLVSDETNSFQIDVDEVEKLLSSILNNVDNNVLARRVAGWRLESTGQRLNRINEQAQSLAERLGKGSLNLEKDDNGLRIDSAVWSKFWSSLIHVVRNAVDHGLETPDDRVAAGKAPEGRVSCSTTIRDDMFVVTISDDGRGINWDRVRSVADSLGLPSESHADLVNALFYDGLSTSDSVSETSGRGIGMGAVKQACESLEGHITASSSPGDGTTFEFIFPLQSMAPDTTEMLAKHGIEDPENLLVQE